jgi:hypothetical protein
MKTHRILPHFIKKREKDRVKFIFKKVAYD